MFKVDKATAVAMVAALGASSALAGGSQDGVIHFTGAIVEAGFRVQSVQRSAGEENALQARASAAGDQVVLDFHSPAMRVVPVDVSVEACAASSLKPLRVGDARGKADVLAKYGGFKANLLTANNGTLTLSRATGAEPALAVVTLSYQ